MNKNGMLHEMHVLTMSTNEFKDNKVSPTSLQLKNQELTPTAEKKCQTKPSLCPKLNHDLKRN